MGIGLDELVLAALIFAAALLYASVGHGGASGYLAAMALIGLPASVMRPSALVLNVLVSLLATYRFIGVGAFSARLFWPLALTSVPCAYLAGSITLPARYYGPLVGAVLIYAAVMAFRAAPGAAKVVPRAVGVPVLLLVGASLGFLSGLTGVGGGIFLSPILILLHWANVKDVSGIAAAFILVNSTAALLGMPSDAIAWSFSLGVWAVAAVAGGYIGAEFGSARLGNPSIQRLLALVLVVAGIKMIATARA